MTERLFLYIDILGFGDMIKSGYDVAAIYRHIDRLNVHRDEYFRCIVFSDTILVYAHEAWMKYPDKGLMWLIEFAQDFVYQLIPIDIHIRAYITQGDFEHYQLDHVEAYYGKALVECYEREKQIKSTGVFLDSKLAPLSTIFKLTPFDDKSHYVHVLQDLDAISWRYEEYPMDGWIVETQGLEWQTAYALRYVKNTYDHANDVGLPEAVRLKHQNAWKMISAKHPGLARRLEEAQFDFAKVVRLDWTEPMRRIGTEDGTFG